MKVSTEATLQAFEAVSAAILSGRGLDELLQLIAGKARSVVGVPACAIYLLEDEEPNAEYLTLRAVDGRPFKKRRIRSSEGVVGEVSRTGMSISIEDIRQDPRYERVGTAHQEGFVSVLACPMREAKGLVGVLCVYDKERRIFREEERNVVQTFGNHAAIVIEITRLLSALRERNEALARSEQRLREAAARDSLTGLYNHGRFWDALYATTGEGGSSGIPSVEKPFGVLIIDIDGFKQLNDTVGHLAGDEVLRRVALHLQDAVGEQGIAARYGGDEFALLIPGEHAELERLAQRIRNIPPTAISSQAPHPTLSVGFAHWPKDATSATELVALADIRLYNEKRNSASRSAIHPGS